MAVPSGTSVPHLHVTRTNADTWMIVLSRRAAEREARRLRRRGHRSAGWFACVRAGCLGAPR